MDGGYSIHNVLGLLVGALDIRSRLPMSSTGLLHRDVVAGMGHCVRMDTLGTCPELPLPASLLW